MKALLPVPIVLLVVLVDVVEMLFSPAAKALASVANVGSADRKSSALVEKFEGSDVDGGVGNGVIPDIL